MRLSGERLLRRRLRSEGIHPAGWADYVIAFL